MATFDENLLAAATALVEAAGGEVPAAASYNEVMILAASTIITNGGTTNGQYVDLDSLEGHDTEGAVLTVTSEGYAFVAPE
jgi:hypothetical protein